MRSLIFAVFFVAALLSASSIACAQGAQADPSAHTTADPSAHPRSNPQHGSFLSTHDATRIHESMARAGTLPSVSGQCRIAQWPHGVPWLG